MKLISDEKVPFAAYFVNGKVKGLRGRGELRKFCAETILSWIIFINKRYRLRGAIMFDIDDTLINSKEKTKNGFEHMKRMYDILSLEFPIHIVTARPDEDHKNCMKMLQKLGFCIPPDRLHMLPSKFYGKDYKYVEDFKWNCYVSIKQRHGRVLARFGDKLWDVAHIESFRGSKKYLEHIEDEDCYIFKDPRMDPCVCAKLPGCKY